MSRNEKQTCTDLIEPALTKAGWQWDSQVTIGLGRVNITGDTMYDETQTIIADYVLRYYGAPLVVLEAKAESISAADGMQQGSRYAGRLDIRFSIATNGTDWVLTDNDSGKYETLSAPPSPEAILTHHGISIDWDQWGEVFSAGYHIDQVSRKVVRPYQDVAIHKTLWHFAGGNNRALLLMATGTGKTFVVFQLVWKLLNTSILKRQHILFLTDRNSLKDQAYRAFAAFSTDERVTINKDTVANGQHQVGKVFFANYQNLDEELDGKKIFEHYDQDFFDLVIIDECHRSGFGDWFGVLEHFNSALQMGLTATPRELEEGRRVLTEEEKRRDTYEYFGAPIYTYSLKQAIEDGYLVPYLLEERITNVDEEGYTGLDGKHYTTANFERDIRMPDRTTAIAEDLWEILGQYDLRDEKSIVFCVDDTHAAFMAAELRRLSGDDDYAGRIVRSERNSHQLERNFATVGSTKPRVAVTVDLLTTGFDAPDVKNIVFVRPLRSAILYKQMKGRGTRLCEDINKRYFTIFDYSGASQLEDAEFDGHPANRQKGAQPKTKPRKKTDEPAAKPAGEGISVVISDTNRYVCLADGRKIPFEEYTEQSRNFILDVSAKSLDELLTIWIDKNSRKELREELRDHDIYPSAFRHYLELPKTDDVDILAKIGFNLVRVPTRPQRVERFWKDEAQWLEYELGANRVNKAQVFSFPKSQPMDKVADPEPGYRSSDPFKVLFWQCALDHYQLFGIDDLEQARTYGAPQFVAQFGSFQTLTSRYGGPQLLKTDLEAVKHHLYVPMTV
ncbi:type I restriction endonuclease subunit R [Desulfosudis oleivorans]|uniref:Type III restriction protein res subunit n=1 Tax=Desulfosudis oleivorans (strain DSM 6200 / JCM 39069 / Hxd3) TaxID=96561 RepID=A8ZY57_DESOH|nr:type I restriction endonuclease subunit R [Desulfosudis oleivorans]ABW67064.1 type III restriction protein res subunit [Desulfosudis oleivorans Hxd3]